MSDKPYDYVIENLKAIAKVPRNRRLRTDGDGFFTLEESHLFVPFLRTLYGEGREKLIRDIKSLLLEVQSQIRILLSSKHLDNTNSNAPDATDGSEAVASTRISDEKRAVLDKLSTIHREMYRSITGFEKLQSVYSSDIKMVGKLEHVVDTLRLYMAEIEQAVPDVADNIQPIMLENDKNNAS